MFGKIIGSILDTAVKTTEIVLKPVEVVTDVAKDTVTELHKIVVDSDTE